MLTCTTARCLHFGTCGGCRSQATPYEEQLKQKEDEIRALFVEKQQLLHPIIGSPSIWHYRNKMEFSFSQNKAGERFLGLMMRGKRRVVDLQECYLTPPWVTDILHATRAWWQSTPLEAYFPPADRGSLRTLVVREGVRTGEKMVVLTLSGNPQFAPAQEHLNSFVEAVERCHPITSIIIRKQILQKSTPTYFETLLIKGKDHIHEILFDLCEKPLLFNIGPDAFFQPNTLAAEVLYRRALTLVSLQKEDTVLDLYCGTGTLGLFASSLVKKVIGIELNTEAVANAHENIVRNSVSNMEVIQGDVKRVLSENFKPTCVIVDPPRAGLDPHVIQSLVTLCPQKILYISCNPRTQKDNTQEFERNGYHIYAIQPVDQFPHTPHIENIVALQRPF